MIVKVQANAREIEVARREYQTDECEIDDDARVSRAAQADGRWVAAWVWVSDIDMEA